MSIRNAWTLAPATKAEILCTWNAFVLQTLGDYAALERGDIAYATDRYGKKMGHFFRAPWSSIYVAYRSVPTVKFDYSEPNSV